MPGKSPIQEKSEVRGLTVPDFQTYEKATIIQTVWQYHKDRHINWWKRIKSPEINAQDMFK